MNRILVIDDELAISELMGEVLRRAGFDVVVATTGRQGVHRFEGAIFDLVVTDMVLPDISGRDVVHHIRNSSRPFTPIVGISGTPWLLQQIACDAILPKPFRLRTLLDLVNRLIRERMPTVETEPVLAYAGAPAA